MHQYTFSETELGELRDIFFVEAYEILQILNQEVLGLEAGHDRGDALRNIQRHVHTLKGNSKALGFSCINTLSHKAEDLLRTLQDNSVEVDQNIIDLMFGVNDALLRYLDDYKKGVEVAPDIGIIEQMETCLVMSGGNGSGGHAQAPAEPEGPRQEPKAAPAGDAAGQLLRVESQRVDKILNLVGELVIGRSMVGQALSDMAPRYRKDELVKRLCDANAFMEKTLSLLQKNVMKIRMLPISQVFRKFPRAVRDLSREKGKEVELVMQGENTELDKSILDVIGEPLIHLVRNAVDHGIEPPDERERAGKRRTGKLTLRASHEGNQIVIDVMDDGRGLDPERLKRRAVEKGVRTQEEADRLSDAEALDLIFLSGFSTAEVVTDISGRGFGMDIVKTTVESLKGKIHVHSGPGEGSTFTLRLPLTLAIIKAMLFKAADRLYALPLSSIDRITRIAPKDVQTIGGRNVLRFGDKVISLVSLREALTGGDDPDFANQKKFVIVVGLARKQFGFVVESLMGQHELVIKALDDHWGAASCTSGASILGSGKVVLILDAPAIIAREIRREAGRAPAA